MDYFYCVMNFLKCYNFGGQKSLNECIILFKNVFMHVFVPKIGTLYKQFLCHRKRCGGMLTKVWSVSSSEWTNCCRGIVCTAAAVRTCSRLTSKVAPVRKVMGKQKPSGSTLSAWRSLPRSLNHSNSHLHHHHHYHHLHLHHPIWTLHALLMQKRMPVGAFLSVIFLRTASGLVGRVSSISNVIFFCLSALCFTFPAACPLCFYSGTDTNKCAYSSLLSFLVMTLSVSVFHKPCHLFIFKQVCMLP